MPFRQNRRTDPLLPFGVFVVYDKGTAGPCALHGKDSFISYDAILVFFSFLKCFFGGDPCRASLFTLSGSVVYLTRANREGLKEVVRFLWALLKMCFRFSNGEHAIVFFA